jgi:hypothetical protein
MPDKRISSELKKIVRKRAHNCCEYCRSQERFATQAFSVEHIIPISQRGKSTINNLALACQGCNNHKYTKAKGMDPITGEIVSLYHPRKQKWRDHFSWNEDFSYVIGLTPAGRATVEALKLNRIGLINLRKILFISGEHPPEEDTD